MSLYDEQQPADAAQPANPAPTSPGELTTPDCDELAQKWAGKIKRSRKHFKKLHERIQHNRKTVAGFNWERDPNTQQFIDPRANLMFSTAQATLPNIYARNPDVSVTGVRKGGQLRLFCETLETVISGQAKRAKLKKRMKMSVLSAMVSYFGIVKITYQRDIRTDPVIVQRINDTQDNIVQLEALIQKLEDPTARESEELRKEELKTTMEGLQSKSEVVAAEGTVIDRILPENLLLDDAVVEFDDYESSDWIAQLVPTRRGDAEATYQVCLKGAKTYKTPGSDKKGGVDADPMAVATGTLAAAGNDKPSDPADEQICIIEIWDKKTELVYTMADGCDFWLRDPFPMEKVGERWYPFFILPYSVLPGMFVAPCLVDLTEKLQGEYNDTRDKFAEHRDLNKPGWVGDSDSVNEKTVKRFRDSVLGEITLIDAQGKPLQQVIMPKQPIPVNPMDYDTSAIRSDWEQVTGLQDAARSTVVQPKTATEANIQQQSLSGRTSEFRDKTEDLMAEMFEYIGQILLQELTPPQVERYTGPNVTQLVPDGMGGVTEQVTEKTYDWPQLSRDQIFDMVEIDVVAGTTGAPDKTQQQQIWVQAFPFVQQLVTQIMQLNAQHIDYSPLAALLEETLKRFDDRIDVNQFLPQAPPPPAPAPPGMPGMQGAAPGQPGPAGSMPPGAPNPAGGMPAPAGMPPVTPPQAPIAPTPTQ